MARNIYNLVNEFPPIPIDMNDIIVGDSVVLWTAVVEQALFDASYGLHRYYKTGRLKYRINKDTWSPHSTIIKYYKEAQEWFIEGNEDFIEVCGMLDLDHGRVQTYAIDMFKEINVYVPLKWRIKNGPFILI